MVRIPRSIPSPTSGMTEVRLVASDGYDLGARVYEPTGSALFTAVVHGATATPQGYYRAFAEDWARHGARVITYDYRGIGASRPESLRGFEARISDWARLDATRVLAFARAAYDGPLVMVGHSFGGQLIGLIDEAREVDAAVLIGAQLGYYGHWPLLQRVRLGLLWHIALPTLTSAFGYLPGRVGLGVDLPAGVADEWGRWCRSPGYLLDHEPGASGRFAAFDRPTLLYSFTDDEFAPAGAVDALVRQLSGAPLQHRRLDPAEVGADEIGHFGFFREHTGQRLWHEGLDFVEAALAGKAPAVAASWQLIDAEIRADLEYGRD